MERRRTTVMVMWEAVFLQKYPNRRVVVVVVHSSCCCYCWYWLNSWRLAREESRPFHPLVTARTISGSSNDEQLANPPPNQEEENPEGNNTSCGGGCCWRNAVVLAMLLPKSQKEIYCTYSGSSSNRGEGQRGTGDSYIGTVSVVARIASSYCWNAGLQSWWCDPQPYPKPHTHAHKKERLETVLCRSFPCSSRLRGNHQQ